MEAAVYSAGKNDTTSKERYPECAVTLSLGERSRESYQRLYDVGAERYLLRHETADEFHYGKLHPKEMYLSYRKECLFCLKDIWCQYSYAKFVACHEGGLLRSSYKKKL